MSSRFVPGWLAAAADVLARGRRHRRPAARRPFAVERLEARDVPAAYTWVPTAPGAYNWNDAANWTGGPAGTFPNAVNDQADLTGAPAGNQLINLNVGITVGLLNVGSTGTAGAYTIAANGATGSLTFGTTAGSSALVAGGTGPGDAVLAPIVVTGNDLTLAGNGAAPLALAGPVSGTGTLQTSGSVIAFDRFAVANTVTLAGIATITNVPVVYVPSFYDGGLYAFNADTGATLATLVAPNVASSLALPAGITTGPDGNLYVSDQGLAGTDNAIVRYNLRTFATETFVSAATLQNLVDPTNTGTLVFAPAGLKFGPDGNLYVAESGGFSGAAAGTPDAVYRFAAAPTGTGGDLVPGAGTAVATGLFNPTGLVFGTAAGDTTSLYVTSALGAPGNVIKVTGATGATPTSAAIVTSANNAGLQFAAGITVGPDGKLYVADLAGSTGTSQVLSYNTDGTGGAVFIATDNGAAGASPGDLGGQFSTDLTFDSQGRLLLVNLGPSGPTTNSNDYAGSVFRYTAAGVYDTTLVSATKFPDTGTVPPTNGDSEASGIIPSGASLAGAFILQAPTISPGGNPGTLTVPGIYFDAGSFLIDVTSSGADELVSTGSVALNGPTLTLNVTGAIAPGSQFTIVSAQSLTGTFAGIPEGSTVTAGGQDFTITYAGGASGHDVVLTRSSAVAPALTGPFAATFYTGQTVDFTATATGFPAPAFTIASGTLPAGLSLDAGTGHVTGNPTAAGTSAVDITATNPSGSDTRTFTFTVLTGAPAQITSANAAALPAGTGGTFTVTTTGTPTPTLAETAALPAGVTFNASTGVLTVGSGTADGVYNLTFTATNGVGTLASQAFTLTVGASAAFTSGTATTFFVGQAGTFTVTATGTPTPTLSESGPLPAGVTFNAATGVLSGTPAAGTAGTYPVTFTATNGFGSPATQTFTLTVQAGSAPAITGATTAFFTEGQAGAFTVTTTGTPAPTVTETGTLPAGVTFDAATGKLSGTPAAGSSGAYPITFTATNPIGSATRNFTLTVGSVPAITSAASTTFAAGSAGTFTVTATGSPAPTLTATGLPAGITLAPNGFLTGTATTAGTFPVVITAANGVGTATQNFTLTVGAAPAFTSGTAVTFAKNTAGAFTVTATGTPAPSLTETGTLPAGVTFNPATGVLAVGTGAAAGTYPLVFTAANSLGSVSQNFALTVSTATVSPPPPVAPTLLPARLTVSGPADGSALVYLPVSTGEYVPTAAAKSAPFGSLGVTVRTAVADVDGDGIPDTIFVTGPGTPIRFAVVSGADNSTLLLAPTAPFAGSEDFTGGGFVAAADLDGDGRAEILVSPDQGGGPRVTIFSLANGATTPTVRANFFGIDDTAFRGGARVAVGDVNADGTPDLAVAAGFLGGPRVAIFNGKTLFAAAPTRLIGDFFAFPGADATTLRNGAYVAAGDVNGDGYADLIFGGGPGGGPRVFVLSGKLIAAGDPAVYTNPIANFFVAGNTTDRGGVRVAAVDADADGKADVVIGSGVDSTAVARVYLGKNVTTTAEPALYQDISPFGDETLADGVYVG